MASLSMGTGAPDNYWIHYAEQEFNNTYSQVASVAAKRKLLIKFGRTTDADANTKKTIATFGGGDGQQANENMLTTNLINRIVSSSTSDTGASKAVTIEGHTIDASGNLTFVVQTATLTGQTPVTLSTSLARCTRIYNHAKTFASPAESLAGNIYCYESVAGGTVTAGVPANSIGTHCQIVAGKQQSYKAATSVSSSDAWFITSVHGGVERGGGAAVSLDFDIEWRQLGGGWRPLGTEFTLRSAAQTVFHHALEPYRIIPPNTDVRMVATSNAADVAVVGAIDGVLATVV